jgi:hypothetical protein
MITALGSDTVTVLRGRTRDNWGNLQGTDTETPVSGCSVQPLGGVEQTDRGELVVTNVTLFAPAGADIRATDRVRWLDDVYAVNGPPESWGDRIGRPSHVQVQLKLTEGNA